uniref:Fucosyltransferase n=1 Tax=Parascaris univalens TaxID=6257 RepID=A0A915A3B7_PARUN
MTFPSKIMIAAQHYFYLAFENSVCRDYVTEKVFWYMEKIIVPIVLKRSFASSILPNGSFIAADDFNSPASLAEHLKYLRSNKEKYMKLSDYDRKSCGLSALFVSYLLR